MTHRLLGSAGRRELRGMWYLRTAGVRSYALTNPDRSMPIVTWELPTIYPDNMVRIT